MKPLILAILILLTLAVRAAPALADDFVEDAPNNDPRSSQYDPFSDYSSFDDDEEQDSDTRFFNHGRFLSASLIGGYEMFLSSASTYKPAADYGIGLSYFFDLKFALEVAFITSSHSLDFPAQPQDYTGNEQLQRFEFILKFYPQNVKKSFLALNPHWLLGLTSWSRSTSIDGVAAVVRDGTYGAEGGGGIEIPFMQKRAFIATEAAFHYVPFSSQLTIGGQSQTSGNMLIFQVKVGMNF